MSPFFLGYGLTTVCFVCVGAKLFFSWRWVKKEHDTLVEGEVNTQNSRGRRP